MSYTAPDASWDAELLNDSSVSTTSWIAGSYLRYFSVLLVRPLPAVRPTTPDSLLRRRGRWNLMFRAAHLPGHWTHQCERQRLYTDS
jgi:hypothetical protein